MKQYDFNELIERKGTDTYKYLNMKDVCGRDDVLPMWVADMDFATPDFVLETIQKRIGQQILGYTCPSTTYKESISSWCDMQYNWEVGTDDICNIPGVVSGIYLAMQAFTEKGDKILIQDPVYHPFRLVPQANDRTVVWNHLVRDDKTFHMDMDALRRDIKGCKMMILCNPHNPAGICWNRDTLAEVARICEEENVLVVSDEIHCDMLLGGRKHIPFASVSQAARERTITLQAPSKTFNLPGIVCAHAIVTDQKLRTRYFNYMKGSDMTLGNVFTFDCASACYSEQGDNWRKQMLCYVEENIRVLTEGLAAITDKIKVIQPEASFLVFLDCRDMGFVSQKECTRFFADKCGLCLNPGEMFGPNGKCYMRINAGCPRSTIMQALKQIKKGFALQ